MNLSDKINNDIKQAMLAKEKEKLEALRAVKSAILLASTEKGASGEVSDDTVLKVLQKLVKQRKESAALYNQQNRADLEEVELFQASVIEAYLPEQMSEGEIRNSLLELKETIGVSGMQDMGKMMGQAMQKLSGKADGKIISKIVKELLS